MTGQLMTPEDAIKKAKAYFVRDFYTEEKLGQLIAWRAFTFVTGVVLAEEAVPKGSDPKAILDQLLSEREIKEAV